MFESKKVRTFQDFMKGYAKTKYISSTNAKRLSSIGVQSESIGKLEQKCENIRKILEKIDTNDLSEMINYLAIDNGLEFDSMDSKKIQKQIYVNSMGYTKSGPIDYNKWTTNDDIIREVVNKIGEIKDTNIRKGPNKSPGSKWRWQRDNSVSKTEHILRHVYLKPMIKLEGLVTWRRSTEYRYWDSGYEDNKNYFSARSKEIREYKEEILPVIEEAVDRYLTSIGETGWKLTLQHDSSKITFKLD